MGRDEHWEELFCISVYTISGCFVKAVLVTEMLLGHQKRSDGVRWRCQGCGLVLGSITSFVLWHGKILLCVLRGLGLMWFEISSFCSSLLSVGGC